MPCVNNVQSLIMALDRPIMFGQLKEVQKKLGKKNFPLVIEKSFI